MRRYALGLALVALCLNGVAAADCGAPELTVEPASAAPGASVVVTGTALRDGICYDTGGCLQRRPNQARPSQGAMLQLLTSAGAVSLGEFEPGPGTFRRTKRVTVPAALPPGPVTLRAVRADGTVLADAALVVVASG